ncbi:MAG TPA: hypothetical protein VI542_08270 [Candidatus Tectomicrobia bacterium]
MLTEKTFLDPHFWPAFGRTLGWSERCDLAITCMHGEEEERPYRGYSWMFQLHCFIQAIAEGNTPDAFFEDLTSSQTVSSRTKNRHQAEKEFLHRSLLFLLAEETCQHAQRVCEEAAVLQKLSKDMVQRRRLARQRRRRA